MPDSGGGRHQAGDGPSTMELVLSGHTQVLPVIPEVVPASADPDYGICGAPPEVDVRRARYDARLGQLAAISRERVNTALSRFAVTALSVGAAALTTGIADRLINR